MRLDDIRKFSRDLHPPPPVTLLTGWVDENSDALDTWRLCPGTPFVNTKSDYQGTVPAQVRRSSHTTGCSCIVGLLSTSRSFPSASAYSRQINSGTTYRRPLVSQTQ